MNLKTKDVEAILRKYGIDRPVKEMKTLLEYRYSECSPESGEQRRILQVSFSDGRLLVVKLVKEKAHPAALIEAQSAFSEALRQNGIPAAKRYRAGDRFCTPSMVDGYSLDVTVEDYIGEELRDINEAAAYRIGRLLAQMHLIAEKNDLHIQGPTLFCINTENDVVKYREFLELSKRLPQAQETVLSIAELYERKYRHIREVLQRLPQYATQGDISINNLTESQGELGIFDFNNAGDNYLISDAVLEGLLVAREMFREDKKPTHYEETCRQLYKAYWSGYLSARSPTGDEMDVCDDIYSVASAMWMKRINYGEKSLENLIESGETKKAAELVECIHKILAGDNS